jgi:nitrate reductase beta subunit
MPITTKEHMMITAQQARAAVETSHVIMTKRIQQIGEKISIAASLGKSEIWLDIALPYHVEFRVVTESFYSAEFTPLQRSIEQEMKQLGYEFKISYRETRIGGGFKSMDEEVTLKMLPYIQVTW